MKRRDFLKKSAIAVGGGVLCGSALPGCGSEDKEQAVTTSTTGVMTVLGAVAPPALGVTLPHEHVLVDFIGADEVGPDRYDSDSAFEVILPYLEQVRELGCETFVECTPAYSGRDAALLKRLSEASGLKMLKSSSTSPSAGPKSAS